MFNIALYLALAIFVFGVLYRVWTWSRIRIGLDAARYSVSARTSAVIVGVLTSLFSVRLLRSIKVFVLDVALQMKLLRQDRLRWFMHMCIFTGFMALLFMHAMDELVSKELFSDYEATINPYLVLRNVFGLMLAVGLAISVYRRIVRRRHQTTAKGVDPLALFILVGITATGFLLEGAKIVSAPVFDRMVEDFSDTDEEEEVNALKTYWAAEYGVVFQEELPLGDEDVLAQGFDLHESSCAGCHSPAQWAFVSYPLAKMMAPAAAFLNKTRADLWLWYVHFLFCFVGLAYLPFSRMFHALSSPLNLVVIGAMGNKRTIPGRLAGLRAMELDACTQCGHCSDHCSVTPVFNRTANANVLPSQKINALKALFSGEHLEQSEMRAIQEGSYACTSCFRCTTVCPVGINLQDLWLASRQELAARGFPDPAVWARNTGASEFGRVVASANGEPFTTNGHKVQTELNLSCQAGTFANCFTCRTCTNGCPVVLASDDPAAELDLVPHQIMHCLHLGLTDMALNSRMIWNCLTCYKCQELCPQGVKVTDIFYEMKNMAYRRLREDEAVKPALPETECRESSDVEAKS